MATEKSKKEPEGAVIQITQEQWDKVMKTMDDLRKSNEMLTAVADKRQVGAYLAKNSKKVPSIIHIREYDGKTVIGWRVVKDYVGKNPLTGVWTEDQQVELVFEDGTQKQVFLKEFESKKVLVPCRCVGKETNEETGEVAFKLVRQDNHQEYLVGAQFVN